MHIFLAVILCIVDNILVTLACDTCSLGDWHPWNHCTKSCGSGGTQTRFRYLCCPVEESYSYCLNEMCSTNVSYSDIVETKPCNQLCYNDGSLANGSCHCQPGHTGDCCQLSCGNGNNSVNCSLCQCSSAFSCDDSSGQCLQEQTQPISNRVTSNENLCNWSSWGTCSHRCGGGKEKRFLECTEGSRNNSIETESRPCHQFCYNGGTFTDGCSCLQGYEGTCCQIECHDGYFGAGCLSKCDCAENTTCDKATGKCLGIDRSFQLIIVIGAGIGGLVFIKICVAIIIVLVRRKRQERKGDENRSDCSLWIDQPDSDNKINLHDNAYDEIPFDIKAGKMKSPPADVKGHKLSKKWNTSSTKSEPVYQGLGGCNNDDGYQCLVDTRKAFPVKPTDTKKDLPIKPTDTRNDLQVRHENHYLEMKNPPPEKIPEYMSMINP